MPALALTDHGAMYGAWHFHRAAKRRGLKPIIGMEAYVAPGDRHDRSPNQGDHGPYYHLVLLARDRVGYRNLVKLSSIGYLEGFYHRPRLDREVLERYSDGLVVSSACLAGEVARHLSAGDTAGARKAAAWYAEVFRGRYYLEVQAHDTRPDRPLDHASHERDAPMAAASTLDGECAPRVLGAEGMVLGLRTESETRSASADPTPGQRLPSGFGQAELNDAVFQLAEDLGLPVIATNDAHFLRAGDHEAHDILLCIGLAKDYRDPKRMRYDPGLYFKSADEIAARFPGRSDVLENTLRIADEINLDFSKTYHLPAFPLPESHRSEEAFLRTLAEEGIRQRYGDKPGAEVRERLDHELRIIEKTGFSGYFLITHDFVAWARARSIPVGPGRGSAPGSIVAYALGITDVDPLAFDLLFERFLNPERVSMPDIDIDFCYERRGEVISYTREKYGADAVGQIVTFGTMKSRAVVRDVGRVLGFESSETDRIAKLLPNQPQQSLTVGEAVERIGEVRSLCESDERYRRLFDYSRTLEGLSRHSSVHAAGIVIAPGPLDDYVPVSLQPGKGASDGDGMAVTQYDMKCLEDAGMLKMDFLGLRTLTVIHDAVAMIRDADGSIRNPGTGECYGELSALPLDDEAVFEMIRLGGNAGVFQFESNLADDKLRAMRCDRFEDLVVTNALIRPGPLDSGMTDEYIRRKVGESRITYPHPKLESVLETTFGIIVYQEQVMRVAVALAEFTIAEADILRKAMGKKDDALIKAQLDEFKTRAVACGVEKQVAEDLATQIATFGRYGFNRAHAVAYSLISYQTAWLKAHYPVQFMAALLTSLVDNTDAVVRYIGVSRELPRYVKSLRRPVSVLPPSVNESEWGFAATAEEEIRFGLGAVRGVGKGTVAAIVAARAGEPFTSLFDFLDRVDTTAVTKKACEALIAAGALDEFGNRRQLMQGLEPAFADVQARQNDEARGQGSLFGGESAPPRPRLPLPAIPDWEDLERLRREKEALGFFISGHPLDRYSEVAGALGTVGCDGLAEHRGEGVAVPCVVTSVQKQSLRRDNSEWGKITIEDRSGTATVLAFRDSWTENREVLEQDVPVFVEGRVSDRDGDEDDPPIFLNRATPLSEAGAGRGLAVCVEIEAGTQLPDDAFERARNVAEENRGHLPICLRVPSGRSGHRALLRSRSLKMQPRTEALDRLREIFGFGRVGIRALNARNQTLPR